MKVPQCWLCDKPVASVWGKTMRESYQVLQKPCKRCRANPLGRELRIWELDNVDKFTYLG